MQSWTKNALCCAAASMVTGASIVALAVTFDLLGQGVQCTAGMLILLGGTSFNIILVFYKWKVVLKVFFFCIKPHYQEPLSELISLKQKLIMLFGLIAALLLMVTFLIFFSFLQGLFQCLNLVGIYFCLPCCRLAAILQIIFSIFIFFCFVYLHHRTRDMVSIYLIQEKQKVFRFPTLSTFFWLWCPSSLTLA